MTYLLSGIAMIGSSLALLYAADSHDGAKSTRCDEACRREDNPFEFWMA